MSIRLAGKVVRLSLEVTNFESLSEIVMAFSKAETALVELVNYALIAKTKNTIRADAINYSGTVEELLEQILDHDKWDVLMGVTEVDTAQE